jgi:secondary thiamine-phosphate synthase enzyme
MYLYTINTAKEGFYNITQSVKDAVRKSGIKNGICTVYCPHTTAGITINEGADPDVVRDLLFALNKTYPDRAEFRHCEGNSAAHLKSSVMGCSASIIVDEGHLVLGTWQAVYFTEFDGPRTRKFYVQITGE